MALTKTLTQNGSRNHHNFTLNVVEDSTTENSSLISFSFTISPVVNGYDWYSWGGRISYSITIGSNTYSGTIPSYDGYSTVTLNSASNIEILHESDGTKTIDVGFSVNDGAAQYYTCGNASASDTFTLSALHKPPLITNLAIAETNAQLTNLSLANNVIVQYLSVKQFTITATLYDSATLSTCNVYYNNALIGTANSNVVSVDFANVSELNVVNNQVGLTIQVVDSKNGITSQNYTYSVIKYVKPTIEATSSTIKRKTGGGTNLTDNKVNLNFVGTCYLEDNLIGNNNVQQVQYKVWNTTEPSYINVSSTASGNNITITNYEISNILYTSVYNYKIKIIDTFGNYDEKQGSIPTGQVVWAEYKDKVNFLALTIGGKSVVPNANVGNYAKIKLTTRYTSSQAAWTTKKVDFTNSSFVTNNQNDFETNIDGVKCNFDGIVLVTKLLSSSASGELDIFDDNSQTTEVLNTMGYNVYHTYIRTVSNGDIINLTYNSGATSFLIYDSTQISVLRIK